MTDIEVGKHSYVPYVHFRAIRKMCHPDNLGGFIWICP